MLRAPFGNVGCRNVRRSNEISALGSAQTVAPMSQGLRGLVLQRGSPTAITSYGMVVRAKATAIMSMKDRRRGSRVLSQGWGMEAVLIIMVLLLLFCRRRRREEPRVTIINYIYVNSSKPSLPY